MGNKKYLFFFLLIFFISLLGFTQEPIYKHFGVDDGLPSSEIFDIYQDKQGYILFATDKGVSRYNGYEFENFGSKDGLPGNVILRFYPQENGQIWGYAHHTKSLFFFNENFDGFTTYQHNDILKKELSKSGILKSLYVDKNNTIYIGGKGINGLLLIKKNGKVERQYFDKPTSNKKPEKYIVLSKQLNNSTSYFVKSDITELNDNFIICKGYSEAGAHLEVLWLTNKEKAVFLNNRFIKIISSNNKTVTINNNQTAIGIKKIDLNNFFAGYHYGGAKIINDKGEIIKEYLKGKSVTNFLKDHEGGYWFTTLNSGVYYVKKPNILVLKQPKENKFPHINSLAKRQKELLIGYKNGDFARIKTNRQIKFKKANKIFPPALVEYDSLLNKEYVYMNGNIHINNQQTENLYAIKLSEPSLQGKLFSTNSGGFYEINKKKLYKFPYRTLDVSISKKDTLIASPLGVFKKNKEQIIPYSKNNKLLNYRSDDIDVNEKLNHFFIATQGAGVVILGDSIFNISEKHGLTSNTVNEILLENDSTLWACTNKGLNKIILKDNEYKVISINKNTGLVSNEVEDVEIINDTLWIGTKNGLCYLPKKDLSNKNQENVYLKIKKIKVNDTDYNTNKSLKLSYQENKITFIVEGISYVNNNLEYLYRLKEVDKKWSITKNRTISFPNLKSGKYTFQVKTCKKDKCDKVNHLEYNFIIKPPFWKSIWFYFLCFFILIGIFYSFFKIRVLTYNKDVSREIMRLLLKKLKPKEKFIEVRANGEDLKIHSNKILYVKSSGNYIDIITLEKNYTIRCKIGDFIKLTPDSLEFLRVHRSYIIRIDKVTGKSKKAVTIENTIIPVGETYLTQLNKIHF